MKLLHVNPVSVSPSPLWAHVEGGLPGVLGGVHNRAIGCTEEEPRNVEDERDCKEDE